MSQGPEHGIQMPASAGGDGRGRCRGDIAGSAGQGKCCRDPRRTPHGKPECSSGLPLLILK
ncbi:unnamed protein product, partial [Staurois parvus]